MFSRHKKIILFSSFLILSSQNSFAWSGFDHENDASIEIGTGNLVRENNVITIFDWKDNKYYDVEVTKMDESFNGTRLEVIDLDSKKVRVLEMEK